MSSRDWARHRLSDLVDDRGITYGVVQPGHPCDGGVPIVRVNNFNSGSLELSDALSIEPSVEAQYRRSRLRGGEVLITLVGTVGSVAIAPPAAEGWNVARAVGVIPISDALLARWVALFLQTGHAQRYLDARLNTTVQRTLNLRDLSALEVPVPPRDELTRVCSFLNAVEDQAATARSAGEKLERLVSCEFRNEVLRQSSSAMVPLTTVARFVNGKNFTKGASGTGRPVIRIRELSSGLNASTVFSDLSAVGDDHVADFFDLLFAWSGTLGVHRWTGPEGLVNQHIFKVIPRDDLPTWFLECWLREHIASFVAIARDKATTMGHIRRADLERAMVRVPAHMDELDGRLGPMDELRRHLAAQRRRLLVLKDALLPKLASGAVVMPEGVLTAHAQDMDSLPPPEVAAA